MLSVTLQNEFAEEWRKLVDTCTLANMQNYKNTLAKLARKHLYEDFINLHNSYHLSLARLDKAYGISDTIRENKLNNKIVTLTPITK